MMEIEEALIPPWFIFGVIGLIVFKGRINPY